MPKQSQLFGSSDDDDEDDELFKQPIKKQQQQPVEVNKEPPKTATVIEASVSAKAAIVDPLMAKATVEKEKTKSSLFNSSDDDLFSS